jgi:hypothetical protein
MLVLHADVVKAKSAGLSDVPATAPFYSIKPGGSLCGILRHRRLALKRANLVLGNPIE